MNYHLIKHDDIMNGKELRVTLFVSGCSHCCEGCHNSQTWDINSGIQFDIKAKQEIFEQLDKDYIDGITLSGGDPLHDNNVKEIKQLITEIRDKYPTKTIWLYTGYCYNDLMCLYQDKYEIVKLCDVLVEGEFIQELADVNYHWAGSTNQGVIDIKRTLEKGYPVSLND